MTAHVLGICFLLLVAFVVSGFVVQTHSPKPNHNTPVEVDRFNEERIAEEQAALRAIEKYNVEERNAYSFGMFRKGKQS